MRLLQSHCNRERATSELKRLVARARSENTPRTTTLGLVPGTRSKRLSVEVNAEIVADYAAAMPIRAIARKHGVDEWTVHHRLKRAGVTKRPYAMGPDEIELTLALRAEGLSYDRIAERVGFSASTVRNVVSRG